MDLRVVVNERQILTLLRGEPLGPLRCSRLGWTLVGVFVEKFAEPIAERVEYTLHFAIATVIRLGRYASEKIVDIVQIQINP